MKPWEFWRLTPREFMLMLDGLFRREDRDWQRTGVLGTWVLAPYQRKNAPILNAYKLLGRALRLWPSREEQA